METYSLPYGKSTLSAEFPRSWHIHPLLPNKISRKASDMDIVEGALDKPIGAEPLEKLIRPGESVTILVADITRLYQRQEVFLKALLGRLNHAGIEDRDIFIVITTGMHRGNTPEEQRQIVGPDVYDRIPVYNHDCRDRENLVAVAHNACGEPILLNRRVVEADRVIATGGIAPHGLAGFSGGRKSILPGIAGYETIQRNHLRALDADFNLHAGIKEGELKGNPVSDEMQEIARLLDVDFMLNVIVGADGDYTHAVSGDLEKAYLAGCRLAKEVFEVPVPGKAPLVVASVGGYPRDIEMYQATKALDNAAKVTEEGGTILFLSECSDGIGSPAYLKWLEVGDPRKVAQGLSQEGFSFPAFIALKTFSLTSKYRVILVSSLSRKLANTLHMEHAESLENALMMAGNGRITDRKVIFMPSAGATTPVIG